MPESAEREKKWSKGSIVAGVGFMACVYLLISENDASRKSVDEETGVEPQSSTQSYSVTQKSGQETQSTNRASNFPSLIDECPVVVERFDQSTGKFNPGLYEPGSSPKKICNYDAQRLKLIAEAACGEQRVVPGSINATEENIGFDERVNRQAVVDLIVQAVCLGEDQEISEEVTAIYSDDNGDARYDRVEVE